MRRISVSLALTFATCALALASSNNTKEALVVFDAFCLGTQANLKIIERMALAANGKPMPSEVLMSDVAIANYGGRGWGIDQKGFRFAVLATSIGTCSILLPQADGLALSKEVENNYPLARPHIDDSGPQINRMYRILDPSRLAGDYIAITSSKKGYGADDMVSIGYISQAAKARISSSR